MQSFVIEGGYPLKGTISPQGAKNEALQVICACLLTDQEVRIKNIPDILDVNNLILLLKDMGVEVTRNAPNDFTFRAANIKLDYIESDEFVKKDTHFLGFKYLGADYQRVEGRDVFEIKAEELRGCYMLLDEASVTGTANIIMASVLAKGTTTIYNAACEPYIQQLCHMLNSMGAEISGIASNLLTIVGVEKLHGTTHTINPDMIEVGSFIGMAAMVGDGIFIENVQVEQLGIIPDAFRRLGVKIEIKDGGHKPGVACCSIRKCLRAVCSSLINSSIWELRLSFAIHTVP